MRSQPEREEHSQSAGTYSLSFAVEAETGVFISCRFRDDVEDEGKRGFSCVKPTAFTLNVKQANGQRNRGAQTLVDPCRRSIAAPAVVKQGVDDASGFSFSPTALYQHVGAVQKRTPSPQRQQHRGGSCRWITSPVPWGRMGNSHTNPLH